MIRKLAVEICLLSVDDWFNCKTMSLLKRKQTKMKQPRIYNREMGKKRKAKEKRAGNCIDKSCVIHDEYKVVKLLRKEQNENKCYCFWWKFQLHSRCYQKSMLN